MATIMTSEGIVPCSLELYNKLKVAIAIADKRGSEEGCGTGLEVEWLPDFGLKEEAIYLYSDQNEEGVRLEVVLDSIIPAVVGEILTAAGKPSLLCSIGWNEGTKAGPTSGGYRFRFMADGTIEDEFRCFPSDEWKWVCPKCDKTAVVNYNAIIESGIPICTACDCEMLRSDNPDDANVPNGEYISIEECKRIKTHLTSCDDDGFCDFCGEQEE